MLLGVAVREAAGDLYGAKLIEGKFYFAGGGVVLDGRLVVAVEDLVEFGEVLVGVGVAALLDRLGGGGGEDPAVLHF